MNIETIVLLLAGMGSIWLPIPQTYRALKKSTAGVSVSTYISLGVIAQIWVLHGILNNNPVLSISNVLSAIFSTIVIYCIVRDTKNKKYWLWYIVSICLGFLIYSIPSDITKAILTASIGVYVRIPQMKKVFLDKDITGVSINTWVIASVTNILWSYIGLLRKDWVLLNIAAINSLTSLVIALRVLQRRRN